MLFSAKVILLSFASAVFAGTVHDNSLKRHLKSRLSSPTLEARSESVEAYYGFQNSTLTACGVYFNDTDYIIGLSSEYVTADYTNNCGRSVIVSLTDDNSTSIEVTVGDSSENDAYLSVAAFEALAGSLDAGILNITWSFIDEVTATVSSASTEASSA
ncbi:uncharacterized protein BT62DRAFT_930999 [Guyanagaster necrorhizus]|uniref:Uncharacterized protein n=1 Tax=Guyanagaster necrorhizus TaxID=856835 RepID=A0A9P7VUG1_9AGAR|nr:uncharacterized protein BT62DRAFT_930999 [Guyanagaster necrorhizus MCA 3950]KAG7447159.1 hypothetical protein BT62DRAFT_930999 [Guyanagaster necrorhizus MCA 3950]